MMAFFKKHRQYLWLLGYFIATLISFAFDFNPGREVFRNFTQFLIEMLSFIPFLFIIVGLFDAWFPKERVEKHIGQESGIKGILVVIVLAMLQAGPLYGAFPVAYILYRKGASIKNIFIYLGAFSSLKIPMLGMEIGYLGIQFTLARTLVSLPLFIGIGYFMEWYLKDRDFRVDTF
ncbi:MAG: putative permease [Syntrophaceae bacterium PtaU1.Bin231]|nr:MAG: putative permease [Syntrophaceae bacterium PtaU1.Bin231]